MSLNKHNFFQVFAEALKPERQPIQTRTEIFDSSDALTKAEKEMLEMAIRNFFDFGKYLNKFDLFNLMEATRKIGLVDLAEQMRNDMNL